MPIVLDVPWPEVKRAAELGVPWEALSQTFNVKVDTIRQRAHREQWLVPIRLQKRLEALEESRNSVAEGRSDRLSQFVTNPPSEALLREKAEERKRRDNDKTVTALAETWEERKDSIRQLAWSIGEKSLSKVKSSGVMVTDAGDLTKVIKVMREAAGFSDQQPAFSLSIFGSDTPDSVETIHELAPSYPEAITDSDDWA